MASRYWFYFLILIKKSKNRIPIVQKSLWKLYEAALICSPSFSLRLTHSSCDHWRIQCFLDFLSSGISCRLLTAVLRQSPLLRQRWRPVGSYMLLCCKALSWPHWSVGCRLVASSSPQQSGFLCNTEWVGGQFRPLPPLPGLARWGLQRKQSQQHQKPLDDQAKPWASSQPAVNLGVRTHLLKAEQAS